MIEAPEALRGDTLTAPDAGAAPGDDRCVHELFARQAVRTPEATAVIDGEHRISYEALQWRSQRLALRLREAGVGPDVPVALLAERSLDAVVGILGVLSAGGAYVPINPRDPDLRISSLLAEAGAPVALVQPHLRTQQLSGTRVIELDDSDGDEEISGGATPAADITPDNLAAVVFTSGSTGTPKGVEIPHRALLARLRNGYRPRRGDLQKAPLSVVAHFSDLLLPLVSGRPVILVPDAVLASARGLLDMVLRFGTTRMVFVPSQLSALLEGGGDAVVALGTLESVIVSGETLTPALVATFKRLLPHVVLMNAYGASEVAGLACMGEVTSPDDVTVGSALPGCVVHVLDDALRPVPPGAPGEVYLGGEQLARGYRGRPTQTRERFVPDPLQTDGHRLYRTGDIAERSADGRIRVLGRQDDEVKIHGFRVNLHEVEAAFERLPEVERAVVVADAGDRGHQLTAHVLARSSSRQADPGALRAAVAALLPPYMVPNRVCVLAALPTLPNGKVDRSALAGSEREASGDGPDGYVAPRTATERVLADIWQDVLCVPTVGAADNFFALGGDSLDATRFFLRAEERGLIVGSELLERAPTLGALARLVDEETIAAQEGRSSMARRVE